MIQGLIAGGLVSLAGCSDTPSQGTDELDIVDVLMSNTEVVPPGEGPDGKAGVRVTMTNMDENVTVTDASFEIFGKHSDENSEEVFNATIYLDEPLAPKEYETWFVPLSERDHDRLGVVGWSPLNWKFSRPTPS